MHKLISQDIMIHTSSLLNAMDSRRSTIEEIAEFLENEDRDDIKKLQIF